MEFKKQHEMLKKDIDEYLKTVFRDIDAPRKIVEAMEYSLFAGGKRLRPAIMLYLAREFDIPDEASFPFCAAIEMIHTYSLIHDDLPAMDNDSMRRGMPTNHIKFGEDIAILAGDGLLNFAFEILFKNYRSEYGEKYIKAMSLIAECAGVSGMIGGQTLDITNCTSNVEELQLMHRLKTGRLFTASVMPMVYLAGLIDKEKYYSDFVAKFGLLFQITDDILDVTGSAEILGKTVGKDELENKTTYVSEFGLEGAKKKAKEIHDECLNIIKKTGREHEYLVSLTEYIVKRKN